ncbi:MAG TPA: MEDS domain-containing protein [Chryseolinea sp.]|nr:MEDS domain-containing protein [Chryseolinea sp.]
MEAKNNKWRRSATNDFWSGIGPGDHFVQIYDDDRSYMNLLEGFVVSGFASNDCVTVIATEEHLHALEDRLRFKGYNVFDLKLQDQYVALNARETLSEFMITNWPDEVLFRHLINRHTITARARKRNVRVFGEMGALLWAHGNIGATVQLEHLWNKICQIEILSLFCAYPRNIIPQSALESILDICESESKMIKVPEDSPNEILYKEIQSRSKTRQKAS